MEYQVSPRSEKSIVDRILSAVNFLVVIVITFCVNYMYIDFLFP